MFVYMSLTVTSTYGPRLVCRGSITDHTKQQASNSSWRHFHDNRSLMWSQCIPQHTLYTHAYNIQNSVWIIHISLMYILYRTHYTARMCYTGHIIQQKCVIQDTLYSKNVLYRTHYTARMCYTGRINDRSCIDLKTASMCNTGNIHSCNLCLICDHWTTTSTVQYNTGHSNSSRRQW